MTTESTEKLTMSIKAKIEEIKSLEIKIISLGGSVSVLPDKDYNGFDYDKLVELDELLARLLNNNKCYLAELVKCRAKRTELVKYDKILLNNVKDDHLAYLEENKCLLSNSTYVGLKELLTGYTEVIEQTDNQKDYQRIKMGLMQCRQSITLNTSLTKSFKRMKRLVIFMVILLGLNLGLTLFRYI